MPQKVSLPTDAAARKGVPLAEGLLYYFPNALAAVAAVSKSGNDQHNPGQPLHWSRGKSNDHADCIMRHLMDAGTIDADGHRHTAKVAWRALALLQEEIEREEGAALPRNCRAPEEDNNKKETHDEPDKYTPPTDTLVIRRLSHLQEDLFQGNDDYLFTRFFGFD
jgi:hypothetical protein